MKAATIRTYQTVHTWTGLLAGFALFVAFYAGALTVFHDDIAAWQNPPWRSANDASVPVSTLIDRLIAQHPEARGDFGIVLPLPVNWPHHAIPQVPATWRISSMHCTTRWAYPS